MAGTDSGRTIPTINKEESNETGITPINTGNAAAQPEAGSFTGAKGSAGSTSSTSGSRKDAAVISQKARDLAALQAGKSAQGEMTESFAAKQQEGPNS